MAANHQGRGVATRVAAALVDLVFNETDLDAVYLANDIENLASRRIPEKLGFTHLGGFPAERELAPADTGFDDRWRLPRHQLEADVPPATRSRTLAAHVQRSASAAR